jgi:aspartate/methionine/tyrosine aminotransferase
MKIEPFEMERIQSLWENVVRYNLAESGVHPVSLEELIGDDKEVRSLLQTELGYSQTNGTRELRQTIASTYEGATEDNIIVVNGTSEANFVSTWILVEPGDEVVMMLPNYMQIWGVARSFGAEIRPFHLIEANQWRPDLTRFHANLSSKTKLIVVSNPNNPTGSVLTADEMDTIVEGARTTGAWLLADEVYRGAERAGGAVTSSFWGKYEKLVITSGLSKAYGMPGLRVGWIVSSPEFVEQAWGYHDYVTIGPSALGDCLARVALRPENRKRLLNRTREILSTNHKILRRWVDRNENLFSLVDPTAGAISCVHYNLDIDSIEFVDGLRERKGVLLLPGEHFLMNKYLRINYGGIRQDFQTALALIEDYVSELT